jgi:long-subunit acyl-CoA synthetase (AMP-forming)
MEAEDPLFLLYTSGSTGKPKVDKSNPSFNCSGLVCFPIACCWDLSRNSVVQKISRKFCENSKVFVFPLTMLSHEARDHPETRV